MTWFGFEVDKVTRSMSAFIFQTTIRSITKKMNDPKVFKLGYREWPYIGYRTSDMVLGLKGQRLG